MKIGVELDLNSRSFLEVFLTLPPREMAQVARVLHRLQGMSWEQVYSSSGLNWEAVGVQTLDERPVQVHFIRLSQKCRALVYQVGPVLRFLTLHPDHDSAY